MKNIKLEKKTDVTKERYVNITEFRETENIAGCTFYPHTTNRGLRDLL